MLASIAFIAIGYILTGLVVVAGYYSFRCKNNDIWIGSIILCMLALPAWTGMWQDPESMGEAHFVILALSLLVANSPLLRRVSLTVLCMLAVDAIADKATFEISTGWLLFYWQSALNILFAYQSINIIYTARKLVIRSSQNGVDHDKFMAKAIHTPH